MVEQLSIAEFERLLSRGRGKAILHLQQYDAAPYRDVIRRCCLSNTSYQSACECSRIDYLLKVIELSGDGDAICNAVIHALHLQTEFTHDFTQLFGLLSQFACQGYKVARQAMYAWCRIHYDPRSMGTWSLTPLLELDGAPAFLFVLDPRASGQYPEIVQDDVFWFEGALEVVEKHFGEAETRQALQNAIQDRAVLREMIESIYAVRQAREEDMAIIRTKAEPRQDLVNISYAELHLLMQTQETKQLSRASLFSRWAQKASDDDLYAAAVDFNALELSFPLRLCYAHIFSERPFPLENLDRFFDLYDFRMRNPERIEKSVHPGFWRVFKNISHPRVRVFALEQIASRERLGRAVALLQNNFEDGDWTLIESLFDNMLGEYEYHELGFSIQSILKQHASPDAIPSLIRLFDANPCSRCREDVVESLVSLNALPDWMADECRYDANLDLRAYAERGFTNVSDD